jgi:hypothetical protein
VIARGLHAAGAGLYIQGRLIQIKDGHRHRR